MLEHDLHHAPAVMTLPARIDLTNAERACARLHAAFASGAPIVIAEFTATGFCDCSSLRRLRAVHQHAASLGGQLRLVIPPRSPVRRLANLVDLDRLVPVYPSLREAAAWTAPGPGEAPGEDLPGRSQELPASDGIMDVIHADRSRIGYWQARFGELCRQGRDQGSRQAQAATWDMLAGLIERHLDAVDEICLLVIARAGPHGPARARSMLDEHQDIREIICEARLQPPGSPLWHQMATATLAAWTVQLDREEYGLLDDLRHAGPALRQQLTRQWRAFTSAQLRDQGLRERALDFAA